MHRVLLVCAALIALGMDSASAQQREAVLQRVDLAGTAFDLVVATEEPGGMIFDLAESPDALLVNLPGGLALGYERAAQMLKTAEVLHSPSCSIITTQAKAGAPVTIYIVPKAE